MNKRKRLVAGIAVGGLGVLMLVVALRWATVSVWATQTDGAGAGPLPWARPAAAKAQAISDWLPIIEDRFDGTYGSTYSIPRVVGTTGAPYQWGRVTRSGTPFTDTLWCVQGWSGSSLVAGTDVYTDGVNTTITYGPLDLRDAITVSLSFRHWITVAEGDGLDWGVSTTGIPDAYQPVTPTAPGAWETTVLNSDDTDALAALPGETTVYLSFRFRSNEDGLVDKGVFLDDVKVWKRSDLKLLHMPLVWGPPPTPTVTPTPTPTPTPVMGYEDNFSDPTSGWPRDWERKHSNENMRGGYMVDRPRAQVWDELMASRAAQGDVAPLDVEAAEARFLGLQDDVYYAVIHDAWDVAYISGPYQAVGDFDLEVRGRYTYAQKWFPGNRYGVLLTKEKVNPEDPHTIHGYSFMVEINPKSDGQSFDMPWWRFKEWYRTNWVGDDAGDLDRTIADDPSNAIRSALDQWNTLRIERRGKEFHLYINGTWMRTVSDDDNTGPFYVGLIGRHTGSGATELSYDMLYEWDDVKVTLR